MPSLGDLDARTLHRLLAGGALSVGAAAAFAPGLCARVLGVEPDAAATRLLMRWFAGRELVLALGLARSASASAPDGAWADGVLLCQLTDMATVLALGARGRIPKRAVAVVLASAPPTIVMALLARARMQAAPA